MKCLFTNKKECERKDAYYNCHTCRVPNSFGFFFTRKKSKWVGERRFILERVRKHKIKSAYDQIEKLKAEIEELKKFPSADEYYKTSNQ